MLTSHFRLVALAALLIALCSCFSCNNIPMDGAQPAQTASSECQFVESGFGPAGTLSITADKVVTGLEVPWAIGFISNTEMLVAERPGRIRLVKDGTLQPQSVAEVGIAESSEGGLLGLAMDPDFVTNRAFYVYITVDKDGRVVNRVQKFVLSEDHTSATPDRIILDDIPAARLHDGGRIHFGPDKLLYVGTGDARTPENAQNAANLSGKLLKIDVNAADATPQVALSGLRNPQGFDWVTPDLIAIADHGPTGDTGRSGADEINFARLGDNLGWPTIYRCETQEGLVTPILSWQQAVPPGGAAIYRGNAIPEWQGNLIVGTLGSKHLHRVVFDLVGTPGTPVLRSHETYLLGESPTGFGRLREVISGPDGELYVTTSNCDGRGTCPDDQDYILRVRKN